MTTLKEKYNHNRINVVTKKIRLIDEITLKENKSAQLIIEAMDEKDLNAATQVIEKLRRLKTKNVAALNVAIDAAEAEINKYTGGGPLTKAWSKLKGVVGFNNPLVKYMTFANMLEAGFRQIPTIIKNNVGDIQVTDTDKSKSLNDLVTDETKKKTLINNMLKALSPGGLFGAFKKVPYVNKQELVNSLMSTPVIDLSEMVKIINGGGADSQQIAQDMKDIASSGSGTTTKQTEPEQSPEKGQKTTPGSLTKSTGTTEPTKPGEEASISAPNKNVKIKQAYQKIGNKLKAMLGNDKKTLEVIKLLSDEGII